MKLLVVSTWLPYPLDNGSRMRAYHLLRHLSQRHALTLLSFGIPRGPEDLAPLREFCGHVEVVPPTALAHNHLGYRGLLSRTPRHFVQTYSKPMEELVAANISRHDAALGLQVDAARYLADHSTIPRIFEEAEVAVLRERYLRERDQIRRLRYGLTWWKSRRFVSGLVNSFDRTTVVSEKESAHLRAIGCDVRRVSVVPNGIEIPTLTAPRVRTNRLIYPGSVAYFANLDAVRYFVREVFPFVRRARPDLVFCVTGSTGGVDIADLAQTEGVTFTGRLKEVDSMIAESAACVVPLRIGGGTRLKILQAMALGTPVVSTTKGIEGLDVKPEQHVLVADSPRPFAEQVLRLLADPSLGCRLAADAQRLVRERYAWGPIGDKLQRVLEKAVEEHASRRIPSR